MGRSSPGRICLIKPSSLGDVVHALPLLSAVRARWPSAHIAWVVNRGLRGLLDGHPELDEVIPFDRPRVDARGLLGFGRFLVGLRRRRFDLAIDAQGLLRSGLMTAATGAATRIGLAEAREGAARFYNRRADSPAGTTHAVDRLLAMVSALGADVSNPRFVLPPWEAERAWARSALADVARPRVVLNLGARWPTKRWPPARFAAVARALFEGRGAGLIAVGAPEDRPSVEVLRAELGGVPVLDLAGRTSLPQLAAIASECDVFLSNDTGPLHLAAAVGARVVGVYTCTSPSRTGPYGPRASAVATTVWCAASRVKRCDRLECMCELGPDRVARAVLDQLDADGVEVAA